MRQRIAASLAAAAVALTPLPAATGAAVVPDCSMMTATPPGTPLVIWCATAVFSFATNKHDDVRLWRSSGNGRWTEAKAANITVNGVPSPPQVSPRWAADHTLYWATSNGLFASTDLGETFELVAAQVTAEQHRVRRVLLTDDGSGVTAAVAGSAPHDVGWVASPEPAPALGSPEEDILFVSAPGGIGVLSWDAGIGPHRVVGYRCDAAYACGTPWFQLPKPGDGWAQQLLGAWRPPLAAATAPTYVAVAAGPNFGTTSVWRIVGGTATPMPAADQRLRALGGSLAGPASNVVMAFDARNQVVMRGLSFGDAAGTRRDALFVSADEGRTWSAVVTAATNRHGRSSGPSGWRPGAVSLSLVPSLVVRPDVWLVNASDGSRYTLLCSRDGGRQWRKSCS